MANQVMFGILSAVILAAALFCVTTKRIMRAATALLFVLFGVAGIYFLLDYTFLGAVQISIYAGGITMIYISAAKQSLKHYLPVLHDLQDFKTFIREQAQKDQDCFIAHCYKDDKRELKTEIRPGRRRC